MREIELGDYLSADNVWTRRLLGMEPFQKRRDRAQVEREYDGDVYGRLLERYRHEPDALRAYTLSERTDPVAMSLGDRIYAAERRELMAVIQNTLRGTLAEHAPEGRICELGAGYGTNFFFLEGELYGGELSANARELARLLGHEIHAFDFTDPASYAFIRPGSTVLTCHALEQVPDARGVIAALERVRERILRVVHVEPLYRPTRHNLLGLLRNRYAELNDYNRNLLEVVESHPEIEVLKLETDVFGNNPLNPSSVLVWQWQAPRRAQRAAGERSQIRRSGAG
jgi:hypothetical protein